MYYFFYLKKTLKLYAIRLRNDGQFKLYDQKRKKTTLWTF